MVRFEEAKKKGDPVVKLRQLVESLRTNRTRTKLNEAPVKKLKEHLESIQEGDLNEIALKMRALLEDGDDPAAKIQKLKDLLPPAEVTVSGDKPDEEGDDTGEDSR